MFFNKIPTNKAKTSKTNIDNKSENIRYKLPNRTKHTDCYSLVINQTTKMTVYDNFSTLTTNTTWQMTKYMYNNNNKFAKKAFVDIISTIFYQNRCYEKTF